MTAVVTRTESTALQVTPDRDELISRYRHLRKINKQHHSEVMRFLSRDWILQNGRRIGLVDNETFILESEDDLGFVFDLSIYTAPRGRSRAVDCYARAAKLAPETDESLVLAAMQHAFFAVVSVQRRHEIAGLVVHDIFRKKDIWLLDESLESSAWEGMLLATRLLAPDRFSMTAGVLVPFEDIEFLEGVLFDVPQLGRMKLTEAIDDRRFAYSVYRLAFEMGLMEGVIYKDNLEVAA